MVRRGFLLSTIPVKHAFHLELWKRQFWEKFFLLTVSVGLPLVSGKMSKIWHTNFGCLSGVKITSSKWERRDWCVKFQPFNSDNVQQFIDQNVLFAAEKMLIFWKRVETFSLLFQVHSITKAYFWRRNQEHHSRWWRLPTKTLKKQLKNGSTLAAGRLWVGGCWDVEKKRGI